MYEDLEGRTCECNCGSVWNCSLKENNERFSCDCLTILGLVFLVSVLTDLLLDYLDRFKGFRQKFPKHLEGWKKIYDSNVSIKSRCDFLSTLTSLYPR